MPNVQDTNLAPILMISEFFAGNAARIYKSIKFRNYVVKQCKWCVLYRRLITIRSLEVSSKTAVKLRWSFAFTELCVNTSSNQNHALIGCWLNLHQNSCGYVLDQKVQSQDCSDTLTMEMRLKSGLWMGTYGTGIFRQGKNYRLMTFVVCTRSYRYVTRKALIFIENALR